MGFYENSKDERKQIVEGIERKIEEGLSAAKRKNLIELFSDEDTYIRKAAYQAMGKLFKNKPALTRNIVLQLEALWSDDDFRVRQTVINAAGEIGKSSFEAIEHLFDKGLFDVHHSVRNAVIGSVKKMGEVNPSPVLAWARKYLHHPDKEIRREICHGIELRGRKHPEDILPLLRELEFDTTARVRKTLVHVLGQISYKKGCLQRVLDELKTWKNGEIVDDALAEIVDVHRRYKEFSALTEEEVIRMIEEKNVRVSVGQGDKRIKKNSET